MRDDPDEERDRLRAELLMRACEQSGEAKGDLLPLLTGAGWSCTRLGAEIEQPGWLERLRTEAERRRKEMRADADRQIANAVERCLADGPAALARMPHDELLGLLPKRLRGLLDDPGLGTRGLLVIGETGVGKTAFAVAAARKIIERAADRELEKAMKRNDPRLLTSVSYVVAWARAFDLVQARRQQPLGRGEAEAITAAQKAPVLVLDDLSWARGDSTVAEVLEVRYGNGRPSIVTAGDRIDKLTDMVGDSVIRRILETGDGELVDLFPRS